MNKKIGLVASCILSGTVFIFLICLIIALFAKISFTEYLSYGVCILLAWSYVSVVCALNCFVSSEKKAAASIGLAIGIMYALLISIVYYTQLTTVLYQTADSALLQAFSFSAPQSWLFNLDLLGYGLMAVSTFFIGLAMDYQNKTGKLLRFFLMLHGICFLCMFVPMLPLPATNEGIGGVIALIFWCLFFLPVGILSVLYFRNTATKQK